MKIGIISNPGKDADFEITKKIAVWLLEKKVEVKVSDTVASKIAMPNIGCKLKKLYENSDIIIVLGGDGTLLSVARETACYAIPLFGINLGHLGFLTEAEIDDMYSAMEKLLEGEYNIEKRLMVQAFLEGDGEPTENEEQLENLIALNDIVITRGTVSRIISFTIYINDEYVDSYTADGIVISTPTGSTAYSLSAGGPIVSPSLNVLIITPVCPHTIHSRAIVVSNEDTIKIEVCESNTEVILTLDGQEGYIIEPGRTVTIRQSQYYTNLIKLRQRSFFDVFRLKMSERCNRKNI